MGASLYNWGQWRSTIDPVTSVYITEVNEGQLLIQWSFILRLAIGFILLLEKVNLLLLLSKHGTVYQNNIQKAHSTTVFKK